MPEKTQPNDGSRLALRARRIASIGAASIALLTASAEARQASAEEPMQIEPLPEFVIAAQEDSALAEELAKSLEVAAQIKEAGFNTLKVTMPWTHPGQCAENKNDEKRFRNAVKAAREHDLTFMLNLIPGGGGGLGKAPITSSQRRCYIDTAISYMHTFADERPGGHLLLEKPNEPNSPTFWNQQRNYDGEWVAPQAVTKLLAAGYKKTKTEATELGIGLTVIGGGLASKHRALHFVRAMGKARQELETKGQIMDCVSYHPYGHINSEPPDIAHPDLATIGLADHEAFLTTVDSSFNKKDYPVCISEYAAIAKYPADMRHHYGGKAQKAPNLISEAEQADYYVKSLQMAKCGQRVVMWTLFNAIDDPGGNWSSSGIMRPDGSPKPAYEPLREAIMEIESGKLDCRQ